MREGRIRKRKANPQREREREKERERKRPDWIKLIRFKIGVIFQWL